MPVYKLLLSTYPFPLSTLHPKLFPTLGYLSAHLLPQNKTGLYRILPTFVRQGAENPYFPVPTPTLRPKKVNCIKPDPLAQDISL